MPRGIELVGRLTILVDNDHLIQVDFRGDVVAVVLADLRAVLALRRNLPRPRRRIWLSRAHAELTRARLELQLWIGARQIGRLASDTRSGWIAASLGLGHMELRVLPILAVLAGR